MSPGAKRNPTPAEHRGRWARLQAIARKHGSDEHHIEPLWLVEDARDPKSPFHADFVWNIQEAAEQQWISTARRVISSVVSIEIKRRVLEISSVAYVRDPEKPAGQSGYVTVEYVKSRGPLAVAVLAREAAQLAGLARRFIGLSESIDGEAAKIFGPVVEAAQLLLDSVEQQQEDAAA